MRKLVLLVAVIFASLAQAAPVSVGTGAQHTKVASRPAFTAGRAGTWFSSADGTFHVWNGTTDAVMRALAVGSTITGADPGSVLFVDSTGKLGQGALVFDAAAQTLALGDGNSGSALGSLSVDVTLATSGPGNAPILALSNRAANSYTDIQFFTHDIITGQLGVGPSESGPMYFKADNGFVFNSTAPITTYADIFPHDSAVFGTHQVLGSALHPWQEAYINLIEASPSSSLVLYGDGLNGVTLATNGAVGPSANFSDTIEYSVDQLPFSDVTQSNGTSSKRYLSAWSQSLRTGAGGFVELGTGGSVAVGAAGTARLRFDGTNLQASLNGGAYSTLGGGGVPTSRLISTTSPITGGGDLSADRTIACPSCTTDTNTQTISGKSISGASNTITAIAESSITNLTSDLAAKAAAARLVSAGAGLQGGGDLTADRTLSVRLNASGGLVANLGAGTNELGIASASVTNAMLANSAVTVSAGTGLSGGGSVSLGGSTSLSLPNTGPGAGVIGGGGAYVDSITLDTQGRVTAATTATPSGSTGNWTFAGDAADDVGANVLTIGATTATGVSIGRAAGTITLAGDVTQVQGELFTGGINAVGTTSPVWLLARNTTAAALGAQQYSPLIQLAGLGWGTTAGTSQAVNASLQVRPIQSTVPTGDLDIGFSIAGGAYAIKASFLSAGGLAVAKVGPTDAQQHTLPAVTSDTVALLAAAQTFTTKTLTSPIVNTATSTVSTAFYAGSAANAHALTITPFITDTTTVAATVGVQKPSRGVEMCGNGWKTTATAGSQAVCSGRYMLPIQNTTTPSAAEVWYTNINGAGKTARLTTIWDPVAATVGIYQGATTATAGLTMNATSIVIQDGTAANALTWSGGILTTGSGNVMSLGSITKQVNQIYVSTQHFVQGAAPSVTCGTGAGATPPTGVSCTAIANSTGSAGFLNVTPTASAVASGATVLSFAPGSGGFATPIAICQLEASNAAAAALPVGSVYFDGTSPSTATVKNASATPLVNGTAYQWSYLCFGSSN